MPNKKSIPLIIILSIVTCGIYYLVWIYQTSDEISRFTGDRSTSPGTEVLLTIITCGIYGFYWVYKYSKKLFEISVNVGMPYPSDNAVLNLILSIFGFTIIVMPLMQSQLNGIWDQTYFNPNQTGGPNPNYGDPYNPYNSYGPQGGAPQGGASGAQQGYGAPQTPPQTPPEDMTPKNPEPPVMPTPELTTEPVAEDKPEQQPEEPKE